MSIAQALLPEFDREVATTRALLERVPEADAEWKPHPKSMALGQLAAHLANLLHWATITCTETEFDVAPPGEEPFSPARFESTAQMLAVFDANADAARAAIGALPDEELMTVWTLKKGGAAVLQFPRAVGLRSFVMNHLIHHRGQMSVYLRLRDVPLPSIYGPTADEPM